MAGKPAAGEMIVVASGKGGVGKTNLALNIGLELARGGLRTVLVDADFGQANADILLDLTPTHDAADVLDQARDPADLLADGPCGLRVLCGISGLRHRREVCELDPARFVRSLVRLRDCCDVLLVDCGVGAGGAAGSFALLADYLMLVTTPEPTAVADTYAALKLLYQRGFCRRSGVVANMVHRVADGLDAVRRLQRVAYRFLGLYLDNLGTVPFDKRVIEAVHRRKPFTLTRPNCDAARTTAALAWRLVAHRWPRRTSSRSWVGVASLFL